MLRNPIRVSVWTAVICICVAAPVRAETRITVHDFYGPNASRLRDDVVNLLEHQPGVTIVTKGQVESSARQLGVDAFSPGGRIALARELQLSAWMTGVIKKQAGKLRLTVVVHDGAQHTLVGHTSLRARNTSQLSTEIRTRLWRRSRRAILHAAAPSTLAAAPALAAVAAPSEAPLATESEVITIDPLEPDPALSKTTAAAEPLPEPEPAAARQAELQVSVPSSSAAHVDTGPAADGGGSERPRGTWRGELLRASIGVGSPYRSLVYSQPLSTTLGDYQLSGAPMVDVQLALHPARALSHGWLAWLGLEVGARLTLSMPSYDRYGNRFASRYDAYNLGLRGRVPLGAHYLSIFSGYAVNRFGIEPGKLGSAALPPSVDYRMIRSGMGAELALSEWFTVALDAAWLQFMSVGEIAKWFPHSTSAGVELAVLGTYYLSRSLYARAAATYQRAVFDFNSEPSDLRVAGGATDQYLALSIGAGVSL